MNTYKKPLITIDSDLAEGIYLASGSNGLKCDSRYMKGNWQAPDYSSWNGGTRGYKQQFACLGCPANTANGCGLLTHYEDSRTRRKLRCRTMATVNQAGKRKDTVLTILSLTGICKKKTQRSILCVFFCNAHVILILQNN